MKYNQKYPEFADSGMNHLTAEDQPLIAIRDLHKSFGDNHVLRGFNLQLYSSENLAIVGKSGSGKSVLIKCVIGLIPYDEGSIKVLGNEISELKQKDLDQLRTEIGFLFQGSALYDSMTVRENLQFPLRRHADKIKEVDEERFIIKTLESVSLAHTIDLMPSELSGGMKRRIALARTLILRPKIILYDEPTSGLDPITSREIMNLILEIQKEYKAASVIITHDMECVRIAANRMVVLYDGVDYIEGTYEDVRKSGDPLIQAFFN